MHWVTGYQRQVIQFFVRSDLTVILLAFKLQLNLSTREVAAVERFKEESMYATVRQKVAVVRRDLVVV